MLPYILLADADARTCDSFAAELDRRIAYATVCTVEDGQSFLGFLAKRSWKDLPSMILVNYDLPDTKAPDLLRELLTDERYLTIPKLVWGPDGLKREKDECLVLGVKQYLQKPDDSVALGNIVRQIDTMMKAELQIA